jgi:hypothetical protein
MAAELLSRETVINQIKWKINILSGRHNLNFEIKN